MPQCNPYIHELVCLYKVRVPVSLSAPLESLIMKQACVSVSASGTDPPNPRLSPSGFSLGLSTQAPNSSIHPHTHLVLQKYLTCVFVTPFPIPSPITALSTMTQRNIPMPSPIQSLIPIDVLNIPSSSPNPSPNFSPSPNLVHATPCDILRNDAVSHSPSTIALGLTHHLHVVALARGIHVSFLISGEDVHDRVSRAHLLDLF